MKNTSYSDHEILDSRGNPTVEACSRSRSFTCSNSIPAIDRPVCEHETDELRDHDAVRQDTSCGDRKVQAAENCHPRMCSQKRQLMEWFELISLGMSLLTLVMLLLTGFLEHILWLIRWAQEALKQLKWVNGWNLVNIDMVGHCITRQIRCVHIDMTRVDRA